MKLRVLFAVFVATTSFHLLYNCVYTLGRLREIGGDGLFQDEDSKAVHKSDGIGVFVLHYTFHG